MTWPRLAARPQLHEFVGALGRHRPGAAHTKPGPELAAAFLELANAAGSVVVNKPRLTLLFLQESRGPAKGARRPARELADRITDRAIVLSEVARHHGLLRNMDPRVGTLITFGAGERLIFEHLSRGNIGDPCRRGRAHRR